MSDTTPASIGGATMRPDGTINLQLRAEGPDGIRGDAFFSYPPDHPRYENILAHVGPIEPGDQRPVLPWED